MPPVVVSIFVVIVISVRLPVQRAVVVLFAVAVVVINLLFFLS